MTTLTREALEKVGQNGDATFAVKVGELEGTARRLTAAQLSDYETWFSDGSGNVVKDRFRYRRERLIGMSLLGEDGKQLFPGDAFKELANMDAGVIDQLYDQIEAGCGLKQRRDYAKKQSADWSETPV